MSKPWYATRDDVRGALQARDGARVNAALDRALAAASQSVEQLTLNRFYPVTATRYFDYPQYPGQSSWRLWLDGEFNRLVSLTSCVVGGDTLTLSTLLLQPDTGPPYLSVEIDLGDAESGAFAGSNRSQQRGVALTGVFGWDDVRTAVGTINSGALSSSATSLTVTAAAGVDKGSLLTVDSERMLVTARTYSASGATLGANLGASSATTSVSVSDPSKFVADETVIIDSERMYVSEVVGSTLVVERAVAGSVLASHTSGATIYAPRTLTVERGATGSTAAAHSDGATVYRQEYPGLIRQLTVAEAVSNLLQEQAGYARTAGGADSSWEVTGKALEDLRARVRRQFGQQFRMRAV